MDALNPMRVEETQNQEPDFTRGIGHQLYNGNLRNGGAIATQPNQYKGVKLNQTLVSHERRNLFNNTRLDNSNFEPVDQSS